MFDILSHQENTNENYTEFPSHLSQIGHHQENRQQQTPVRMRENESSHCWWECKLVQPLGKSVWRFSKKLKNRLILLPSSWTYI
jgi:hypothetical protein